MSQSLTVGVKAEAYRIDVEVLWPNAEKDGLDFGSFKVVEPQQLGVELVNNGKYEVGYKFLCRRPPLRCGSRPASLPPW